MLDITKTEVFTALEIDSLIIGRISLEDGSKAAGRDKCFITYCLDQSPALPRESWQLL